MRHVAPRHAGSEELSPLAHLLRCLECAGRLRITTSHDTEDNTDLGSDGTLVCLVCGEAYELRAGTPRMVRQVLRTALEHRVTGKRDRGVALKRRTADAFGYEWKRFGGLREEWRKNFVDYMRPHDVRWLNGRLVLDVGTGSGRHSYQAAKLGASVVALDLGPAIDVARRNLPRDVLTVQADAEDLPFEEATFDLVMSIGVLHHLPDPERAFYSIVRYVRPGGYIQIYVYWIPPRKMHVHVLKFVAAVRRVTTRMPHPLLHALSYPLAAALFVALVLPYRVLRRIPTATATAEAFPLKTYADYPFRVCVNDQFDRFSAPIEHRFTATEVEGWLRTAGLEAVQVIPHHGWIATGRVPSAG